MIDVDNDTSLRLVNLATLRHMTLSPPDKRHNESGSKYLNMFFMIYVLSTLYNSHESVKHVREKLRQTKCKRKLIIQFNKKKSSWEQMYTEMSLMASFEIIMDSVRE